MTQPIQVRISRGGNEIGSYPSDEVVRLSSNGTLKETDFYWHEGMTDWAPLSQFLASEARRKLAVETLRRKQEEVKEAARLALERAKAKEDEERAAIEARMDQLEKEEKANQFRCNCCRGKFPKPKDTEGVCVGGIALVVLSPVVNWITFEASGRYSSLERLAGGVGLGLWLTVALFFFGISLFTVGMLKSPCCPICESTNFSRPEKKE